MLKAKKSVAFLEGTTEERGGGFYFLRSTFKKSLQRLTPYTQEAKKFILSVALNVDSNKKVPPRPSKDTLCQAEFR